MSAAIEAIKVTVSDPATGEVLGEQVIENDYLVVTAGNRHVDHVQTFGTGTHGVTIKTAVVAAAGEQS